MDFFLNLFCADTACPCPSTFRLGKYDVSAVFPCGAEGGDTEYCGEKTVEPEAADGGVGVGPWLCWLDMGEGV